MSTSRSTVQYGLADYIWTGLEIHQRDKNRIHMSLAASRDLKPFQHGSLEHVNITHGNNQVYQGGYAQSGEGPACGLNPRPPQSTYSRRHIMENRAPVSSSSTRPGTSGSTRCTRGIDEFNVINNVDVYISRFETGASKRFEREGITEFEY